MIACMAAFLQHALRLETCVFFKLSGTQIVSQAEQTFSRASHVNKLAFLQDGTSRDVPRQPGMGRLVVPLSLDKNIFLSRFPALFLCPEKTHCPVPLETLIQIIIE